MISNQVHDFKFEIQNNNKTFVSNNPNKNV